MKVIESAGLISLDQGKRGDRVFMRKATKVAAIILSLMEALLLVTVGNRLFFQARHILSLLK
jgi:preprotein translocase subunit SecY